MPTYPDLPRRRATIHTANLVAPFPEDRRYLGHFGISCQERGRIRGQEVIMTGGSAESSAFPPDVGATLSRHRASYYRLLHTCSLSPCGDGARSQDSYADYRYWRSRPTVRPTLSRSTRLPARVAHREPPDQHLLGGDERYLGPRDTYGTYQGSFWLRSQPLPAVFASSREAPPRRQLQCPSGAP